MRELIRVFHISRLSRLFVSAFVRSSPSHPASPCYSLTPADLAIISRDFSPSSPFVIPPRSINASFCKRAISDTFYRVPGMRRARARARGLQFQADGVIMKMQRCIRPFVQFYEQGRAFPGTATTSLQPCVLRKRVSIVAMRCIAKQQTRAIRAMSANCGFVYKEWARYFSRRASFGALFTGKIEAPRFAENN